jgi:hypothetical protein
MLPDGLIVVGVALFLGKAAHDAHRLLHDGILHPLGKVLGHSLAPLFYLYRSYLTFRLR